MTVCAVVAAARYINDYVTAHLLGYKKKRSMAVRDRGPDNSDITFSALLADGCGFKLFMEHVVQEYSDEHLTFLVELLCIKHRYQLRKHNHLEITIDPTHCAVIDIQPNDADHDSICSYFIKSDGSICGALKLPLSGILISEHPLCSMSWFTVNH